MHYPSIKHSKSTPYFSDTSMDYYKFPEGQTANRMDICLSGIFSLLVSAKVIAFSDYVYLKTLFQQNVQLRSILKDATEIGPSLACCW
jgi:hypothetical protein